MGSPEASFWRSSPSLPAGDGLSWTNQTVTPDFTSGVGAFGCGLLHSREPALGAMEVLLWVQPTSSASSELLRAAPKFLLL